MDSNEFDMRNAIDNCANKFRYTKKISKIQGEYMRETKRKVSSRVFGDYVDSLNILGFRTEVEKVVG